MRTKKWFSVPALIALLFSVAVVESYPESSPRKESRVRSSGQGKPRSGASVNWSGVSLRKLKVLREQDGVTLEITATRPVTPTLITMTSPDRLVLDFPNTLSAGHQNVVAVNYGGVKSVRIGVRSNPPMTRLVVDLLQPRTSELVAVGDTVVLKLRSVHNAGEKAVVLDARTAIDSPIEIAAVSGSPLPPSGVEFKPPYLPGMTLNSTENREHGRQPSPGVQKSADSRRQTEESSRNSSATEGSGTIASSGQEVAQQMPVAGKPSTPDNEKPESQQAVNQVLPATGQGVEPSTPANGSDGTLSSPAAAGEMKAAPTNQPLSNKTAQSPEVQETAHPPTLSKDSSTNSSAIGGSGTTASSGQEVGQQMPAPGGPLTPNNGKPEAQQTVNQVLPATAQGGEPTNSANGSNGTVSSPAAAGEMTANGNANAQWKLGLGYLKGIGAPQDERKAAEWFKTAANQGDVRAQSGLSDLYFDGRGVPRDYVRAYTWASIATGLRGNDNDRLRAIRSRMTAAQIEDAHRRISSWWEHQNLKPANPVVPVSLVASLADPAPRNAKDTKITTSQKAPATKPEAQVMSGNPSSQNDTHPASSEQNAAAALQQPASAPAQPNNEPELAKPSTPDTTVTSSQNAPVTPPQTPPQPQQPQQQQATPGNQSGQTDTPTARAEQNAAATIQQPVNAPAQPDHEPEPGKPSTPDTKITSWQNAPATPPPAEPQEQQQAMPGNLYSQTDAPKASNEQNAAPTTIQQPVNAPGQPNHEPEPAKPSTPDTKITSSQNAPVTPPQTPPEPQQPEQQQATPGNQSSQTDTPTARAEQNAAATIQQPVNAPAQPDHEPEPAKPSTPDTKITSSQNAPVTPPQTPPQSQQPQQQQALPGNQSSPTDTPEASSEQNAAATTIQQPVNTPGQPNHEPEPANPSTLGGGPVSAIANSSLTASMAAPPLNAAGVAGTVDRVKQQPSPDEYVIGEQDVLAITVWKERELSGSVVVRPDGKITLPLVDDVKVVGLTPAQLRAVLIDKLKPFVSIPQVTVAVSQINSRKVYLIGEVSRTGTFAINSSTTVLQILAQAGGLKDYAKRKNIYVMRNEQGKQVRYRFNYDEVIRGRNSQQNILLQPADTVIVP